MDKHEQHEKAKKNIEKRGRKGTAKKSKGKHKKQIKARKSI